MSTGKKVSIEQFYGKRTKVSSDDILLANHKKAVITHFLHNKNNDEGKHFQKDAKKYLKEYVKYQEDENKLSILEEDAFQQLLQ